MIRRLALLLVALLMATFPAAAEVLYKNVSVTATSATTTLDRESRGVLVCNLSTSANNVRVRLFTSADTPAAAVAGSAGSSLIPVGACKSFDFDFYAQSGDGFKYLSAIAESSGTATVGVDY